MNPKAIETAPLYVIHKKLTHLSSIKLGERDDKVERDFWQPINIAWDALAYGHYGKYSLSKHHAGYNLSDYCKRTHETTIKLSDPQVGIIDALAEAVGIPHERGQAEIEIPKEGREYEECLEKYHSERERRK